MPRLLDELQAHYWACRPEFLMSMGEVLVAHAEGDRLDELMIAANTREPLASRLPEEGEETEDGYRIIDGLALIPIGGVITKRSTMVSRVSSGLGTSTAEIRRMFHAAQADQRVKGALLVIDSPGGQVRGMDAAAIEIRNARAAGFPVRAYADDLMASGGYWLGAQAEWIYQNSTALIGSLGVFRVMVDSSAAAAERGRRVIVISSTMGDGANLKGAGEPGTVITKEQIAEWQSQVDGLNTLFAGAILAGRSHRLSAEQVNRVMDGSVKVGPACVEAGLSDAVASLEEAIDDFANRIGTRGARRVSSALGGSIMPRSNNSGAQSSSDGSGGAQANGQTPDPQASTQTPGEGDNAQGGQQGAQSSSGQQTGAQASQGGEQGVAPPVDPRQAPGQSPVAGPLGAAPTDPQATQAAQPPVDPNAPVQMTQGQLQAAINQGVASAMTQQAAVATERRQQIEAACAGFDDVAAIEGIRSRALADPSVSVAQVQTDVLEAVRKQSRPLASISVGESGEQRMRDGMALGMMAAAMPTSVGRISTDREYGDRVADMLNTTRDDLVSSIRTARGERLHLMGLRDLARQTTRAHLHGDDYAAAFSHDTSDFPNILRDAANKTLIMSFLEENTTWRMWCRAGSNRDFKKKHAVTMSELGDLVELFDGKPPPETTLNDRGEGTTLREFGRELALTRKMMVNDDVGAFLQLPELMGRAAARVPEQLAYIAVNGGETTTMSDGTAFFASGRGNLLAGSALSHTSAEAAVTAMNLVRGFGEDTAELEVEPRVLLVPTGLRFTAQTIATSPVKPGGTNNEPNTIANLGLNVASSNRLHRNSATAWYLVADPSLFPAVEVAFLNGSEVPIISELSNGSARGIKWEILFDCDAALISPEGMVKNPGA